MLLFPKKVKRRKWQKNRKNPNKERIATRGTHVAFGNFGLCATSPARIRSNHIESARRVITRSAGKTAKLWIRIFPDRPFTKKAAEVGMGKGKGDVEGYEVIVKPGRVIFELSGVAEEEARLALIKAGKKLPLTCKVIKKIV